MINKWKMLTTREKAAFLIDLMILVAMAVLYLLYFAGILDYNAKTFAWCLFPFHFFANAFGKWKVDRDAAVRFAMLGGFVAIFASIGLAGFLMVYF